MKVIVFDTETTGLFNRKWNIEKDNDKFPYIVQLVGYVMIVTTIK